MGSADPVGDEKPEVEKAVVRGRGAGRANHGKPGVEELSCEAPPLPGGVGRASREGNGRAVGELKRAVVDPGVHRVALELEVQIVERDTVVRWGGAGDT